MVIERRYRKCAIAADLHNGSSRVRPEMVPDECLIRTLLSSARGQSISILIPVFGETGTNKKPR
jgi:hypothetical protein